MTTKGEELPNMKSKREASAEAVDIGQHWRMTDEGRKFCSGTWPDEVVVTEKNDFHGDTLCQTRVLKPAEKKGTASPMGTIVLYEHYECVYDPNKWVDEVVTVPREKAEACLDPFTDAENVCLPVPLWRALTEAAAKRRLEAEQDGE